jgi:hypothetical protein
MSPIYELILRMEKFHEVTTAIVYPTTPGSGRALAVVVASDRELRALSHSDEPRAFAADAHPPLWQPIVVLSLASSEQRTVAHELTHLISFSVVHHQPRWLAEGMAEYFESAQFDPQQPLVLIGAAPQRYGNSVHLAPTAAVFDWDRMQPAAVEYRLYQTAWALFAFLINEHKAELARYLWLIDRTGGRADDALRAQRQQAWDQAFPSLPVNRLDDELRRWLQFGMHHELTFRVRPRDISIAARRLSDADAYAARSLLLDGQTPERQARGRAERSHALALDPTNVLAWSLQAMHDERPSVTVGREIAAAHPEDWRAWLLAAIALAGGGGDPAEFDHARGQACELLARNHALVAPPELCPQLQATPE